MTWLDKIRKKNTKDISEKEVEKLKELLFLSSETLREVEDMFEKNLRYGSTGFARYFIHKTLEKVDKGESL